MAKISSFLSYLVHNQPENTGKYRNSGRILGESMEDMNSCKYSCRNAEEHRIPAGP
jgi:hypothetical protein